jgi:hypothetical protein
MNPDSISPDRACLDEIKQRVIIAVETYLPPALSSSTIGVPLSPRRIEEELNTMRNALVQPYWSVVELRDTYDQVRQAEGPNRQCVVVADDGQGTLLLFDPSQNDFALATATSTGLVTIGVRGDAVGCFMSR